MKACRHLDHDKEKYPSCDLVQVPGMDVKYWFRREVDPSLPQKVQFCKLRGRINDVFSCYNEGERACHEPVGTVTDPDAI